jgi:REP element-mobilizing transposase RayT
MPYWQLFYHIVWATKGREPLLTPRAEPVIHGFLQTKAIGLGATVFALDGAHDHVHIVASIPPKLAVAKFIGQIKAVASTRYNKLHPEAAFFWQAEYGAFSFDAKRLPNYIAYVRRQKEHHAQNTLIPVLERTSDGAPAFVREPGVAYAVSDAAWWREMEGLSKRETAR